MKTYDLVFAAGETKQLNIAGAYFRIVSDGGSTLNIRFRKNGANHGENASGVNAGYYAIPEGGFTDFEIDSVGAQTVKIAISDGRGGYDRMAGTVSVSNFNAVNGTFSQSRSQVTNTAQNVKAANANRRYLFVQNNDPAIYMRVNLNGGATPTAGIRLAPGDSLEFSNFCPTGAVSVCGETASATANNCEHIEA